MFEVWDRYAHHDTVFFLDLLELFKKSGLFFFHLVGLKSVVVACNEPVVTVNNLRLCLVEFI